MNLYKTNDLPKFLHKTGPWESLEQASESIQKQCHDMAEKLDLELIYYNDNDCESLIKKHMPKKIHDAYQEIIPGAYKADIFRYVILYLMGGTYSDISHKAETSFNPSPSQSDLILTKDSHEGKGIQISFISAIPRLKFLMHLLLEISDDILNGNKAGSPLSLTGPIRFRQTFEKYFCTKIKKGININYCQLSKKHVKVDLRFKQVGKFKIKDYENKKLKIYAKKDKSYRRELELHSKSEHYDKLWHDDLIFKSRIKKKINSKFSHKGFFKQGDYCDLQFKENIIGTPAHHKHYNGWKYIINELNSSLRRQDFILHTFLDRDILFFPGSENLKKLETSPWYGIIHFPPTGDPSKHPGINSTEVIKKVSQSKISKTCKGLIALSAQNFHIIKQHSSIPPVHVQHPKFCDNATCDIEQLIKNKTIQHTCISYRSTKEFLSLHTKLKKYISISDYKEKELLKDLPNNTQFSSVHKSDEDYISDLTSSIGFSYYIDVSASNLILEHLLTATPIVVNRHPAIEEYLGKEYPMYYENIHVNPDSFLMNDNFLKKTHDFLKDRAKLAQFSIDSFIERINQLPQ